MIWLIIKSVHFILIFLFFQSGETNLNCFLLSDNVAPVALFDGLHSCVLKFPGEKSKHSKMCFARLQVFLVIWLFL